MKDVLNQLRSELQKLVNESAALTEMVVFDPEHGIEMKQAVLNYERDLIIAALNISKGRQKRAAELLKLSPSTLNMKIKSFNIDPHDV